MRFWCCLLLLMASLASFAQSVFRYRNPSGNLTVNASGGLVEQLSANHLKLTLNGRPVTLLVRERQLSLAAPKIVCDLDPRGKGMLNRAVATGGLRASQSNDVLTSGSGTYVASASGGTLMAQSNVRLQAMPANGKSTLSVAGAKATAVLGPSRMMSAHFEGSVRAEVVQPNGARMVATGRRLDWTDAGNSSTLALSGSVSVTGTSAATFGEILGADKVTVSLDGQGQVRSVRVSNGASQ